MLQMFLRHILEKWYDASNMVIFLTQDWIVKSQHEYKQQQYWTE